MAEYQESGPELASVVGSDPEDLADWRSKRIRDNRPLALFHAKFWGKSMADEEEEWRNSRPPIGAIEGELGDKDGDGDERMNEGSDETMHGGQGTEVEDDILPGCYLLDIGIRGLDFRKIWVRAEYQRVYNLVEAHYKKPGVPYGQAPAVVVTGQPGIGVFSLSPFVILILTQRLIRTGKSVWIYYALRRRFAEEKPVIWYKDKTCFLFTGEGVYEAPPSSKPSYFEVFVWTLVDSDEARDGVPDTLVPHGTRHFVIYATSPLKERWSRLHKTVRSIRAIMNPWTRAEIFQA